MLPGSEPGVHNLFFNGQSFSSLVPPLSLTGEIVVVLDPFWNLDLHSIYYHHYCFAFLFTHLFIHLGFGTLFILIGLLFLLSECIGVSKTQLITNLLYSFGK